VAIETMGVWKLGTTDLVSALGRRLAADSGDPIFAFFLKQRIDNAMHYRFLVRLRRGLLS